MEASRFLSQAAFGGTANDIARVQALGFDGWLNEEFGKPTSARYFDLVSPGGPDAVDADTADGKRVIPRALWRKFIASPDVLRQRITLALTEIFVLSVQPVLVPNRGSAVAYFMDILEGNAFGNYRDLLMKVSKSPAMAAYLTFLKSRKAANGSQPDENYARELMQLFSIGISRLNPDGTPVLVGGALVDTYSEQDVQGLARVFTGWVLVETGDAPGGVPSAVPLINRARDHELGTKSFLGTTVPANTDAQTSLQIVIDTLMAHPNMAPFVSRQLIQRLVTSNPSPAYVARVAKAFEGNGSASSKGDMKATLRAIFLDPDARAVSTLTDPSFGKLREPMVRFIQWARTFKLPPGSSGYYAMHELSDPATALAQSPLTSPSVFNFFRPGYVPPNSTLGDRQITAPEFQITTESSVAGYMNFMQLAVSGRVSSVGAANYDALRPLVPDSAALLAQLNLLLAAGQISQATLAPLQAALDTISVNTSAGANNRLYAAVLFVLCAPEYIVQK